MKVISMNLVMWRKVYDCLLIVGQLSKILYLISEAFEILFTLSLLFSYCFTVDIFNLNFSIKNV